MGGPSALLRTALKSIKNRCQKFSKLKLYLKILEMAVEHPKWLQYVPTWPQHASDLGPNMAPFSGPGEWQKSEKIKPGAKTSPTCLPRAPGAPKGGLGHPPKHCQTDSKGVQTRPQHGDKMVSKFTPRPAGFRTEHLRFVQKIDNMVANIVGEHA